MARTTVPDTPVTLPDALVGVPSSTKPSDPSLPRYEPLHTLGEGGMGEVRLCRDRRIGREVAMKVMRAGTTAAAGLRTRFLREALVQGQLEHPAIVPVYDVATAEDGTPYFTMKRVNGVTLEETIDALREYGEDPAARHLRHKLLTAMTSVCLAVHLAHIRGVLHRDLKPSNIMLGDFGEVYVLDWGVAKLAGEAEDAVAAADEVAARDRTELGAVPGTPGYIAPERFRHVGAAYDERSDVYALGAILFEILTTVPLHFGGDPTALRDATLRGANARPSVRTPARDVPPELEAICVKATAANPADRFVSARALHDALVAFLEGDRDLEHRRRASTEHAIRARAALASSSPTGAYTRSAAARSEAIRDLGRALALDPSNAGAADALVGVLTEPPADLPQEALDAVLDSDRRLQQVRTRVAGLAFLFWFVCAPLWIWAGIRSWVVFFASGLTYAATAAAFLWVSRRPRRDGTAPWYLPVLSAAAVGMAATFNGPLLLPATLGAALVGGLSLAPRRGHPYLPFGLCALAIVVPAALELLGVVPPSYRFEDGMMCALPRLVDLAPAPTYAFMLLFDVAVLAVGAFFGVSVRNTLDEAHRRMHLHAWQLRQLVPREAASALAGR